MTKGWLSYLKIEITLVSYGAFMNERAACTSTTYQVCAILCEQSAGQVKCGLLSSWNLHPGQGETLHPLSVEVRCGSQRFVWAFFLVAISQMPQAASAPGHVFFPLHLVTTFSFMSQFEHHFLVPELMHRDSEREVNPQTRNSSLWQWG